MLPVSSSSIQNLKPFEPAPRLQTGISHTTSGRFFLGGYGREKSVTFMIGKLLPSRKVGKFTAITETMQPTMLINYSSPTTSALRIIATTPAVGVDQSRRGNFPTWVLGLRTSSIFPSVVVLRRQSVVRSFPCFLNMCCPRFQHERGAECEKRRNSLRI